MELSLNMNAMNQVIKGVAIYKEKESVESICLVLKGRILVHREGMQMVLGSGNFLGLCDVYSGQNSVSYTTIDNAILFPFPVRDAGDIPAILQSNKEYGGLMVASLSRYIRDLNSTLKSLINAVDVMVSFVNDGYDTYRKEGKRSGFPVYPLEAIETLAEYEKSDLLDMNKAEYYSECAGVAIDVQKAFYQKDTICLYHIEEQAELARQLILECSEVAVHVEKLIGIILNYGDECLFKRVTQLIINLNKKEISPSRTLLDLVERMVEKINEVETLYVNKVGKKLEINRQELENLYYIIISGETHAEEMGSQVKEKVMQLKGSMRTILEFGKIEEGVQAEFSELIQGYKNLKDKSSTDDGSRKLRKQIASHYYKIYEKVFLQSYNKKECPVAVDLFLKYGFLDETLMREEQLEELVQLEETDFKTGLCAVYDMKTWLTLVYTGKKLPSKSEFDLDFEEYVRSLRKTNEITEEEGKKMLLNLEKRLQYEIQNVFSYNNRLISGQMSIFVPFLTENSFITGIQKAYLTAELVNNAIEHVREVDYSIFCREIMFEDLEHGIKREYVVHEVFPDIILFPVCGENAIMWQDLSGRKRDSKGRFLLPMFTVRSLEEILVKVFGRYRWESCRTSQGANWNNIKVKSLTSEYMDYLQFYRKNKELSEEKKEKLKTQIQKCRNNSREVFAMDYELWVRNEAEGAIRLNKVVREMMATYCPFARRIRESVKNQPLFADAMNRYNREKLVKVKELDLRHKVMEKEGISIPESILRTYEYYQKM